jgi:hypothetical protein
MRSTVSATKTSRRCVGALEMRRHSAPPASARPTAVFGSSGASRGSTLLSTVMPNPQPASAETAIAIAASAAARGSIVVSARCIGCALAAR